ncbi:hypothetical protein PAPYR_11022 [Paratrimastix pyriformis]|uniref:Uncharacterized protein n=1 Tax=Paratrimastix pyriformis TaxID=342808 RepID=A0ABQ8U7J5_9EUKA|nr:hypothetical protein PAPYR_11022 [Paratrimastix pyriformis]
MSNFPISGSSERAATALGGSEALPLSVLTSYSWSGCGSTSLGKAFTVAVTCGVNSGAEDPSCEFCRPGPSSCRTCYGIATPSPGVTDPGNLHFVLRPIGSGAQAVTPALEFLRRGRRLFRASPASCPTPHSAPPIHSHPAAPLPALPKQQATPRRCLTNVPRPLKGPLYGRWLSRNLGRRLRARLRSHLGRNPYLVTRSTLGPVPLLTRPSPATSVPSSAVAQSGVGLPLGGFGVSLAIVTLVAHGAVLALLALEFEGGPLSGFVSGLAFGVVGGLAEPAPSGFSAGGRPGRPSGCRSG